MHQLQQLHREFDIAQPADAQLELAVFELIRHIIQYAPAHGLDVFHEGIALRGRPHHRPNLFQIVLPQRQVTGHRPRLEQRLEFPGLCPPAVVGHVRIQRAHQRPRLALRPQVRIDIKKCRGTNPVKLRG